MSVPTKSAMTHTLRYKAEQKINSLCYDTITATVPLAPAGFTENLINAMFDQNTQRILREAHDVVERPSNGYYGGSTTVMFHPIPEAYVMVGGWYERHMAVPSKDAVKYDLAAPGQRAFENALIKAVNIAGEFAVVKQVVQWLDLNASVSAIRYYFPTVLSLLPPDQDKIPREIPPRYIEPHGIASYIPLLREAAGTVAAALLLPTENLTPDEPLGITVTLVSGGVARNGIECPRDSVNINL